MCVISCVLCNYNCVLHFRPSLWQIKMYVISYVVINMCSLLCFSNGVVLYRFVSDFRRYQSRSEHDGLAERGRACR